MSLLRISRDRDGALELAGRSWQEDGSCPRDTGAKRRRRRRSRRASSTTGRENGPGTRTRRSWRDGEIRLESADRAAGYFTTRASANPKVNARTSGVYLRADPEDMGILDGSDERQRAELIAARLRDWKSIRA